MQASGLKMAICFIDFRSGMLRWLHNLCVSRHRVWTILYGVQSFDLASNDSSKNSFKLNIKIRKGVKYSKLTKTLYDDDQ